MLRQRHDHGPRLAGKRQQHMRFNVEQIVDALPHARIVESLERRDRLPHGAAPGEAGAFARGNESVRRFLQRRIAEEFEMRFDDLAPRCAAGGGDETDGVIARVRDDDVPLGVEIDDLILG